MKKLEKSKAKSKPRTARSSAKQKQNVLEVKPYQFRSPEARHLGEEPTWPENCDRTFSQVVRALSWYNYYFVAKEAKEMLVQWLSLRDRKEEARRVKSAADSDVVLTHCWFARMNLMGMPLQEHELAAINTTVEKLTANKTASPVIVDDRKPTIQDRLLDKIREVAGEIDGLYDDFVKKGAKLTAEFKPIAVLRAMNAPAQQINYITAVWERELAEFQAAVEGHQEVAECYDKYSKIQLRNMVKFAELVLSDCQSYLQVKKTERKPRAKKAPSAEKLAIKFKYLAEFVALKLKSELPAKLVAAQEAWLFDVAKRKLIHVVADANVGSLTVKGSSIVGYDAATTVQKTIRKPEEILAQVKKEGKPALRKIFKEIKATETKWTGRSNENLVIVRVW